MPSKIARILPIKCVMLPLTLVTQPYYLTHMKFTVYFARLYSQKINIANVKDKLFIKQKGICFYCGRNLLDNDNHNVYIDILGNALKVYHLRRLEDTQHFFKSGRKQVKFNNNSVLLHQNCCFEVIQTLNSREPSAEKSAR